MEWRHSFPEAFVRNLPHAHSDHCPVLVTLENNIVANHHAKPFRFEAAWQTHSSFSQVLRTSWNNSLELHSNLHNVQIVLQHWNSETFGNIFKRKRILLARLGGTQRALECNPNPFLFDLEKKLCAEYNEVLNQEELLWFQKSRENWVQLGDRNTRFFHTTTLVRRNKNRIHMIKDGAGIWISDAAQVRDTVLHHFYIPQFYYIRLFLFPFFCPKIFVHLY